MFERMEQNGDILNIFRAMSHSPEALRRFMKFGQYFLVRRQARPETARAGDPARGLALPVAVRVLAARLLRPPHRPHRRPDPRHPRARRGSVLRANELAVLHFATEMTSDAKVSDATFAAVRGFLVEEEIVELTMVTAFYNLVSRVLNTLQVDVDAPAREGPGDVGIEASSAARRAALRADALTAERALQIHAAPGTRLSDLNGPHDRDRELVLRHDLAARRASHRPS